jgi:hypothetical protein
MRAKVWLYQGNGGWHFLTLPKKESNAIKSAFGFLKRGWGSLPVNVTIGSTKWKTPIFPDKKHDAYLLPIKSDVRRKESIEAGKDISFSVEIIT